MITLLNVEKKTSNQVGPSCQLVEYDSKKKALTLSATLSVPNLVGSAALTNLIEHATHSSESRRAMLTGDAHVSYSISDRSHRSVRSGVLIPLGPSTSFVNPFGFSISVFRESHIVPTTTVEWAAVFVLTGPELNALSSNPFWTEKIQDLKGEVSLDSKND